MNTPSGGPINLVMGGLLVFGVIALIVFVQQALVRPRRWVESANHLAWRPFSGRHAIGIALILLVLQFVTLVVLGIVGTEGIEDATWPILLSTLTRHWAILILAWRILSRNGWSLRVAFGGSSLRKPLQVVIGVLGYLALLPILSLVSAGTLYFIRIWNDSGLPFIDVVSQPILDQMHGEISFRLIYSIFTAVVLAPVGEEVFFRGIMLPPLARKVGSFNAIVLVSVIFGAIHLYVVGFPVLFTLAMVLGLGYMRTGSLLVPIVLHMVFNLMTVLAVNIQGGV